MAAIVPAPKNYPEADEPVEAVAEPASSLVLSVRIVLLCFALVFAVVLGIAVKLDPYRDGRTWTQETHTQLGLPKCTFYVATGIPCPSCGMTTSFSLLMHGDLLNSLRANWVGTSLASFCALFIPWAIVSVVRKQTVLVQSVEIALTRLVAAFLWLLIVRWVVVIVLMWQNGLL
jgi:hypothetical protein